MSYPCYSMGGVCLGDDGRKCLLAQIEFNVLRYHTDYQLAANGVLFLILINVKSPMRVQY